MGFSGKESVCNAGEQEFQSLGPGKPHGQRSLTGISPWCHKELDITEATEHTHK